MAINSNPALFAAIGSTFGGDGTTTFALPSLQGAAPNGLTYYICVKGVSAIANGISRVAAAPGVKPFFGISDGYTFQGGSVVGIDCPVGDVRLTTMVASGVIAKGQFLHYNFYRDLIIWIGSTFGGDGFEKIALPSLQSAAPNGLTYYICNNRDSYPGRPDAAPVPVPAVAAGAGVETLFGTNTGHAVEGALSSGASCILGDVLLTAAKVAGGIPALGQILAVGGNERLFSLLSTRFGGDGPNTFALPNLQGAAPNGLTYYVCVELNYP